MTEQDLYAMGQESPTAFYLMRELCKAFDLPYPPKQNLNKSQKVSQHL